MAAFLVSAATILGFIIYCFVLDSESLCGASDSFWHVMCRLLAKHVKLAFKLAFWFIVAGALIFGSLANAVEGSSNIHVGGGSPSPSGGGPESEKFYRTLNKATAPLRWAVDGFTAICGALAMLVCVSIIGCNGLPSWEPHERLGQGFIIYDGSHLQEVEALADSPRCVIDISECAATGVSAPVFDHSGGTTRDGGMSRTDFFRH